MTDVDLDRAARILAAAEQGTLTDIHVVSILKAVRAEGAKRERELHVSRLRALGLRHHVRGEHAEAKAIELAYDTLTLPGDVA
jgi:hypothetical protein